MPTQRAPRFNVCRRISMLVLMAGTVFPLPAQTVSLIGTVQTPTGDPVKGVRVILVGVGDDLTTGSGGFDIKVPAARVGQQIAIQVLKSGWHIVQPANLSIFIPADSVQHPIRIVMASNSSDRPAPKNVSASKTQVNDSDLLVSALQGTRLEPLPGRERIRVQSSATGSIYPDGFKASFTLAHNRQGSNTITVRGVSVDVLEFIPGKDPRYSYQIDPTTAQAHGSAEPNVFNVTLAGKTVEAFAIIAPDKPAIRAVSNNMFSLSPIPKLLTLHANSDDVEEIVCTVVAKTDGTYRVRFQFEYNVAGQDRQAQSAAVWIYRE